MRQGLLPHHRGVGTGKAENGLLVVGSRGSGLFMTFGRFETHDAREMTS